MILFIADLHLSSQAPGLRALFSAFLEGPAQLADEVYVLGDFVEYWIGDDILTADPWYADLALTVRSYVQQGKRLAFLHGNRDFLLGAAFAEYCGARILPDPYVLSVPVWQFVLTHGDQLCTDDDNYMNLRYQLRDPDWQRTFLAHSLPDRVAIAQELRQRSEHEKKSKPAQAMDVNIGTVEDFIRAHGYATLIHGHTHRPGTHDHIVDGIHCQRWVLSDWRETACGQLSDYLCWDGDKLTRHSFGSPEPNL